MSFEEKFGALNSDRLLQGDCLIQCRWIQVRLHYDFQFFPTEEDHTSTTRWAYGSNLFAKGSPRLGFFGVI